jgi:S1-C subfamily serine protease/DNA-binding beta-propeller fold protein YncE
MNYQRAVAAMVLTTVAAMGTAAMAAGGATAAELAPLPVPDPATTMAMTEDGLFVLIAHQAAGKISIWDVKSGKLLKTVECVTPGHILCCGQKVYVANADKGTITVIDIQKQWTVTDQLMVGQKPVSYLSAPGGKYFKGVVLATCGKLPEQCVMAVDVTKDSAREVNKERVSAATWSYDGSTVVQQSAGSGTLVTFRASDYLAGNKSRWVEGERPQTPVLYQVREGAFWFGQKGLYAGDPPKLIEVDMGDWVFPDLTRAIVYSLKKDTMTAYAVNMAVPRLGSATVTVHERFTSIDRTRESVPGSAVRRRTTSSSRMRAAEASGLAFSHPAAATHGDTTYFFVLDPGSQMVFHVALEMKVTVHAGAVGKPFDGARAASAGADNFPARIVEGKKVTFPLYADKVKGTFTVVNGPDGTSIAPDGTLSWTPGPKDVGPQRLKIRAEIDGKVSFLRIATEVISKDVAARVQNDPARLGELGVHYIIDKDYTIQDAATGPRALLLMDGETLKVIDEDGLTVTRELNLKMPIRRIADRANYYVTLPRGKGQFTLIDKSTLSPIKSIDLPGNVGELALHPTLPQSYVSIYHDKGGMRSDAAAKRVIVVNEKTAAVSVLPRVYGQWILVHPSGKYLYVALHDLYRQGDTINWYTGRVIPSYGNIDLLVSYEIDGDSVRHCHTNLAPGANGRGLRASPDGAYISYVSGGGYRSGPQNLRGYTIPAFPTNNVETARVAYNIGAYPIDVSYHPALKLVAACNEKDVNLFNRDTGENLSNKLDLGERKLSAIRRVYFTPGGRHLLIDCEDEAKRRALRAFPLRLTDAEQAELARCRERPRILVAPPQDPSDSARSALRGGRLAVQDLDALAGANTRLMTPTEIARAYKNAVVLIKSDHAVGTGFLIGKGGYVLTCAHVIPPIGDPKVSFLVTDDNKKNVNKTVPCTVLKMDERRDLALLRTEAPPGTPTVRLAQSTSLEMGDKLVVIGHPGLGSQILDYSMTEGIVSNPKRMIEGLPFIQTTATLNRGASGGPAFDRNGNVVGVAVLKAAIESTGFAIPADDVIAFLKSAVGESKPATAREPQPAPAPQAKPEVKPETPKAKPQPQTGGEAGAADSAADRECRNWLSIAQNFMSAGKMEHAREYFNKIIQKYPKSKQAEEARQKLKEILSKEPSGG